MEKHIQRHLDSEEKSGYYPISDKKNQSLMIMKQSVRCQKSAVENRLEADTGLEMSVVCAQIAEHYLPLSQHVRSLLSPLVVLAFPINADMVSNAVSGRE